jgi:hypothetical protein
MSPQVYRQVLISIHYFQSQGPFDEPSRHVPLLWISTEDPPQFADFGTVPDLTRIIFSIFWQ